MFDFEIDVITKSKNQPVLVQFSAPSCGPCLWLERQLIQIHAAMRGRFNYVSLALDDYADEGERYDIKRNPTTILFLDGIERARFMGALPQMAIEQWLEDNLEHPERYNPIR